MPLLFVFDMDNVLYDYDWRVRMRALEQLTGLPVAELRKRWWAPPTGELNAEAGGYAGPEEYFEAFTRAIGVAVPLDDWLEARASAMTPWPDSIAVVERAAELGQVSLLTNNGPMVHAHLPRLAPELVPIFGRENLRASSFYGARKPDPLVFERMLDAYGQDASDTFFADDLPENVAAAESVGITAHLFTDSAGMREAVEGFARLRS